jgi:hypothetical protein
MPFILAHERQQNKNIYPLKAERESSRYRVEADEKTLILRISFCIIASYYVL